MPNREHRRILEQGKDQWNIWREAHPEIQPNLSDANLRSVDLSDADLSDANLINAKLSYANLKLANLSGAKLIRADLIRADLSGAKLNLANLSGVDLSDADLSGADLSYANLNYANLINADLNGANLTRANLRGADLNGATIGYTSFGDRDLREIKGLGTIHHFGSSPLSVTTIYQSRGNIPEVFVRGTGTPDGFIEYMRTQVAKPTEYYTCFISYSSNDERFAKQLHNDLQQKGVRCWFAPDDMDIGDKIKHRIDTLIILYDKLLLILSQSSIESPWVKYEVEGALDKEPKGIFNVLYPVRIDDTILTCHTKWARDIKETRHIGNFTDWNNPQAYQANFQRLLRALEAKEPQQSKQHT